MLNAGGSPKRALAQGGWHPVICVSGANRRTLRMAFDLKEIVAARLGENYELHERHLNRTLVAAQRVIGFDKVYARAEGAYLYDMDNTPYLDFLSGYSVFNIGRNHPAVKKAIRDVLDLDLPNMVQMDCSLLSGLLAEAITETNAAASRRGFLLQLRHRSDGGRVEVCARRDRKAARHFTRERVSRIEPWLAFAHGLRKFHRRFREIDGRIRNANRAR